MLHFRKLLGIMMCTVLIGSSCTEDNNEILTEESTSDILDKGALATATINEKLAYKEFHLTNLMEKVLEINPNFNQLEQLKGSKEERPRFYIESLLNLSGLNSKSRTSDTESSLAAFVDLEGETWYPVVKIIENEGNPMDGIFLVNSYDVDADKEFSKAYKVNNGKLEVFVEEFTEEIYDNLYSSAKASPSLMTLELTGWPGDENFQKAAVGCGGGGGGTASTFKLKTINIKDKKESSWERADIHHSYTLWNSPIQPGSYWDSNLNPSGFEIRKVRNSELNDNLAVDEILVNRSSSGVLQHIIFEHDNYPAFKKTSYIPGPNNSTFEIKYRSWNSDYHHQLYNVNRNESGIPSISNFSFDDGNEIYYEIR